MKPIVIAIVGASGTGKSELARYLETKLGIKQLASYTTRPMRPGEKQGEGHIFTTESRYAKTPKHLMLAHTVFGGHHYWTEKTQLYDHPVVSYVIDEKGANILYKLEQAGEAVAFYFQIVRPDNPTDPERLARDNDRVAFAGKYDAIIENAGMALDDFLTCGACMISLAVLESLATGAKNIDNQPSNYTLPVCLYKKPQ